MDSLTKVNFWDNQRDLTPLAMKSFCDWIDDYKKKVGWNVLFGGDVVRAPKFHDLPYEMQIGVIERFFTEQCLTGIIISRKNLPGLFAVLNNQLNVAKSKHEKN